MYRPRDPRAKLREVTVKWVSAMRVTGRTPNRAIAFGHDGTGAAAPQTRGFLVDDRRPQASGQRYLILEDGDVLLAPERSWLAEPNDEVVTLLARSLADARMGGSGWLADEGDALEVVPDRREERSHHDGPERRSRN